MEKLKWKTIFPGLTRIRQEWGQTCGVNYDRIEDPTLIEIDLLNGAFIEIRYDDPGYSLRIYWLWGGLTLEEETCNEIDEMLEMVSHFAFHYTREVVEQDTYDSTILMGRHRIFQCLG